MDIANITTSPLPLHAREPILLVIDAWEERSKLLIRLLAFANYKTYAVKTLQEASIWYTQYAIVPEIILFGYMNSLEHFFFRLLRERMSTQRGKDVPAISLALYFPDTLSTSVSAFSSASQGCFALLELLWQVVPRDTPHGLKSSGF